MITCGDMILFYKIIGGSKPPPYTGVWNSAR